MDYIRMTREFINAMGQPSDLNISDVKDLCILDLRMRLITEEVKELTEAYKDFINAISEGSNGDITPLEDNLKEKKQAFLKELCDLQYVLSGLAVTFKLPFDEAFSRVHQSNMSKLGDDGKPIYRDDGKVLKGPNYRAPDLSDLI